jgi:membrane protein DedA with SNARE-associated domain
MVIDLPVVGQITEFVQHHAAWAAPVVFALAFAESLAFISLLVPSTVILFGLGALIGAGGLSFWPIWLAAALGAAAGDWVSFAIGGWLGHDAGRIWPLSRHPTLLPRAHAFFTKWGTAGVFFGRFLGPLRATVPLIAGICEMPKLHFQFANVTSAFVWATLVLAPGHLGMQWLTEIGA